MTSLIERLKVPTGPVDLTAYASDDQSSFDGTKDDAPAAMEKLQAKLTSLQECLYANGSIDGATKRVVVLLQGMDTSGKGGVIEKAVGLVSPQGLAITSFKRPTDEELAHDFLWRIGKAVPKPGYVGVFDRSQYEDVLIGRVRKLATDAEIERRYDAINTFEAGLAADGVTLIKCFLHITSDDQKERLEARLDDSTKHWKFNPGDIDERMLWDDYQHAYEIALERCNTDAAPWFVIPSGSKWLRNWAVAQLLAEHLEGMNLEWPAADFDVAEQKARLAAT